MDNAKSISDFLNSLLKTPDYHFETIPTKYTYLKQFLCQILNEIMDECNESTDAIFVLASYPIQKWAFTCRKIIGIDEDFINSLLLSDYTDSTSYFGLMSEDRLRNQKQCLNYSKEMLSLCDDYFSLDTEYSKLLANIHSNSPPIYSSKEVKEKYKESVYDFVRVCAVKICIKSEEIDDLNSNLDQEIDVVYHDTEILIKTISYMKNKNISYEMMDIYNAILALSQCILMLDSYPFNPSFLSDIVRMKMDGKTQKEIAKYFNITQAYVSKRYDEAVKLISILIWGFSCNEILLLMKYVQVS